MGYRSVLLAAAVGWMATPMGWADLTLGTGTKIVFPDGTTMDTAIGAGAAPGHGGNGNSLSGTGAYIGGGWYNAVDGVYTTVSGGLANSVRGPYGTIGGGGPLDDRDPQGTSNIVHDNFGTIGGGGGNNVGTDDGDFTENAFATVAGGRQNTASGYAATVGGGERNVGSGSFATVAGGFNNSATGSYSAVVGGYGNVAAGLHSVAMGNNASALHHDTFVWSDSLPIESTNSDQFIIHAANGVGINTTAPETSLHVVKDVSGGGNSPAANVAVIENLNTGSNADVLMLKIGAVGAANTGGANNFISFTDGANDNLGALQSNGTSITLAGAGADFAEWLPKWDACEVIEPGDIVGVRSGMVSKAIEGAHQVMVVSTAPIVSGNDPGEDDRDSHALVAFVGQADVNVRGAVTAGEYIIAAAGDGIGFAVSVDEIESTHASRIVGQALENASAPGVKKVRALVGARARDQFVASLTARVEAQEARLAALEQANEQLAIGLSELRALVSGEPDRYAQSVDATR